MSGFESIHETLLQYKNATTIPQVIHRIWVGDLHNIPSFAQESLKAIQEVYPDFYYVFWTDGILNEFLSRFYPQHKQRYNQLQYNIQRADYARVLLLYHYGGIYLDLDLVPTKKINFACDRPNASYVHYVPFNNAILASPAEKIFWKIYADKICARRKPWWAGVRALEIPYLTGPYILYQSAMQSMEDINLVSYDTVYSLGCSGWNSRENLRKDITSITIRWIVYLLLVWQNNQID